MENLLKLHLAWRDFFYMDILKILKRNKIEYKSVSGTDEKVIVCPSCGKDNHFYFNVKKNLGICHRCRWQCNLTAFLMAVLGLTVEAARELSEGQQDISLDGLRGRVLLSLGEVRNSLVDVPNHEVFFKNPLPKKLKKITKKNFPRVFKERKVSFEIAIKSGALFCDQLGSYYYNRIIFPIKTLGSETFTAVTALSKERFKTVSLRAKLNGKKYRKSLFPKHSFISEILFGYDLFSKSKKIVIVEGIWDVLALWGLKIPTMGLLGSSLSKRQAQLLSNTKADIIYIMLDGSVPMVQLKKIQALLFDFCLDKEIRICVLPDGKDPDEASVFEIKNAIVSSRIYSL